MQSIGKYTNQFFFREHFKCLNVENVGFEEKCLIIKNLMACLRKVCMVAIKALKVSGTKKKQQEEHFCSSLG